MKKITEIKENWNDTKRELRQKFAKLKDSDLILAEGMQEALLGRLHIRLGKSKEELRKIIEAL